MIGETKKRIFGENEIIRYSGTEINTVDQQSIKQTQAKAEREEKEDYSRAERGKMRTLAENDFL